MAHNVITIDRSVDAVWAVLADADNYGDWVVGADSIRGVDVGFPAPGTRFYHRVGIGPVTTSDHTEVIDSSPPYRLELRAKARPLGTARVILLLSPRGEQETTVTMIEEAADPLTKFVFNPLTDVFVRGRNVESLRRLKRIAEGQRSPDAAR